MERCDLTIEGMHCAACVARVEKALKQVPGVQESTVNLLAERGAVTFDARQTRPEDLIAALDVAGYDAHVAPSNPLEHSEHSLAHDEAHPEGKPSEAQTLLRRFLVSLALTVPVLVMGMGPHVGLIPMHLAMQPA